MVEAVKKFIKNEDPIVWKSLCLASVVTISFYVFVLVYTKTGFGLREIGTFLVLFAFLGIGVWSTIVATAKSSS